MKKILLKILMKQREKAYKKNLDNISALLEKDKQAQILDLGCDDGKWTKEIAERIQTKNTFGVEIVEKRAKEAESLGINVKVSDLNENLPFDPNFFDVIHANQVIEHLNDTDNFVSEVYRVLKPGGYAIISTENLASWHNIFALILGYTPFSLTNASSKTAALGNPLAPHHNEDFWESASWQHQRVFAKKGLDHLFQLFGFKIENVKASGYYPFFNILSKFDKIHSAFLTYKIRK